MAKITQSYQVFFLNVKTIFLFFKLSDYHCIVNVPQTSVDFQLVRAVRISRYARRLCRKGRIQMSPSSVSVCPKSSEKFSSCPGRVVLVRSLICTTTLVIMTLSIKDLMMLFHPVNCLVVSRNLWLILLSKI